MLLQMSSMCTKSLLIWACCHRCEKCHHRLFSAACVRMRRRDVRYQASASFRSLDGFQRQVKIESPLDLFCSVMHDKCRHPILDMGPSQIEQKVHYTCAHVILFYVIPYLIWDPVRSSKKSISHARMWSYLPSSHTCYGIQSDWCGYTIPDSSSIIIGT